MKITKLSVSSESQSTELSPIGKRIAEILQGEVSVSTDQGKTWTYIGQGELVMNEDVERPLYYLLNPDHSVRPARGLMEQVGQAFDREELAGQGRDPYRVAYDQIGDAEISTVFLVLDHSPYGAKRELFETMVFGGSFDDCSWRYATWEEAEAGHRAIVAMIKEKSSTDSQGK